MSFMQQAPAANPLMHMLSQMQQVSSFVKLTYLKYVDLQNCKTNSNVKSLHITVFKMMNSFVIRQIFYQFTYLFPLLVLWYNIEVLVIYFLKLCFFWILYIIKLFIFQTSNLFLVSSGPYNLKMRMFNKFTPHLCLIIRKTPACTVSQPNAVPFSR